MRLVLVAERFCHPLIASWTRLYVSFGSGGWMDLPAALASADSSFPAATLRQEIRNGHGKVTDWRRVLRQGGRDGAHVDVDEE